MPMLSPPKSSRPQTLEPTPATTADRRAERRRRERLYEIEFFRGGRDYDDLFDDRRADPSERPRDPRLARAIEAAANGWVVKRYG